MPTEYNERRGRLVRRVIGIGAGGMNSTAPTRTLPETVVEQILNAHPNLGRIEPAKAHQSVVYDLSGTMNEIVYHMHVFEGAGSWLCMFGNTKVYVDNTGTPVDKTPLIPFTSTSHHRYEAYNMMHQGEPVVVCNNYGADKPHYWDEGSGDFLILTDSYKGKCCVPFLGSLFMGHSYESGTWYPNRLRWSDSRDITAWDGITSGWYDLENKGAEIRRLGVLRRVLWVFCKSSVYRVPPTGNYLDPIEDYLFAERGIAAPWSLQQIENGFIFVGTDDIYACGPNTWERIGTPIRKEFFANIDPAELLYAWSFVDARQKRYYLVTEMIDTTRRAWVYNYEERNWSIQDFATYTAAATWVKI